MMFSMVVSFDKFKSLKKMALNDLEDLIGSPVALNDRCLKSFEFAKKGYISNYQKIQNYFSFLAFLFMRNWFIRNWYYDGHNFKKLCYYV